MNKLLVRDNQEATKALINFLQEQANSVNRAVNMYNSIKYFDSIESEVELKKFVKSPISFFEKKIQDEFSSSKKIPLSVDEIVRQHRFNDSDCPNKLNGVHTYNEIRKALSVNMSESFELINGQISVKDEAIEAATETHRFYAETQKEIEVVDLVNSLCHSLNEYLELIGKKDLHITRGTLIRELDLSHSTIAGDTEIFPNKERLVQIIEKMR